MLKGILLLLKPVLTKFQSLDYFCQKENGDNQFHLSLFYMLAYMWCFILPHHRIPLELQNIQPLLHYSVNKSSGKALNVMHLSYDHDRTTSPVLLGDYCLIHTHVLLQSTLQLICLLEKDVYFFLSWVLASKRIRKKRNGSDKKGP